ncbi:hypothetical protein BDK51DRAFT_38936 [Blyttiomyces helicus]|uniref:Uncharacterized protein n=1 Tax=Blyttiomyces helicus TaxID=388810 RepID=A0A4P9WCI8_9FUNG|nr:hypothetical protein BDK51DRAFT_38936 [Blyttiomyces helicus]|eukprot:RKO88076.1 hypothetical protein BDK51DRAFT_38936 [Blyttiomyces helicus]
MHLKAPFRASWAGSIGFFPGCLIYGKSVGEIGAMEEAGFRVPPFGPTTAAASPSSTVSCPSIANHLNHLTPPPTRPEAAIADRKAKRGKQRGCDEEARGGMARAARPAPTFRLSRSKFTFFCSPPSSHFPSLPSSTLLPSYRPSALPPKLTSTSPASRLDPALRRVLPSPLLGNNLQFGDSLLDETNKESLSLKTPERGWIAGTVAGSELGDERVRQALALNGEKWSMFSFPHNQCDQTATYALGVGSADAAGGRLLLVEQAEVGLGAEPLWGDVKAGACLARADNDNLNDGNRVDVGRAAQSLKAQNEDSGGEHGDDEGAEDLHGWQVDRGEEEEEKRDLMPGADYRRQVADVWMALQFMRSSSWLPANSDSGAKRHGNIGEAPLGRPRLSDNTTLCFDSSIRSLLNLLVSEPLPPDHSLLSIIAFNIPGLGFSFFGPTLCEEQRCSLSKEISNEASNRPKLSSQRSEPPHEDALPLLSTYSLAVIVFTTAAIVTPVAKGGGPMVSFFKLVYERSLRWPDPKV